MATAVLVCTFLLALCGSALSQASTLTFSNQFPAELEDVTITCDAPTITNPSDLSVLAFFDTTKNFTYTMTRDCSTSARTESSTGFGQSIKAIEGTDQKIYLQLTYFRIEFSTMSFQCTITSCSTHDTLESNTANITVLANPDIPRLHSPAPRVNENIQSNVTFYCKDFVGYPGGNLELIMYHRVNFTELKTSLANFSTDAQGYANGTYVISLTSNRTDIASRYVACAAYNTLNSQVPRRTVTSGFLTAYPPNTIKFLYYANGGLVKETNGSFVINLTSPFSYQQLKCAYDEAAPAANIEFTQIAGLNATDQMDSSWTSETYGFLYHGTGAFTLVFNCTVSYESSADPNIKKFLTELATVNVHAMATMVNVSYLLLLSALATLWKI